jgi:hypothetical protein
MLLTRLAAIPARHKRAMPVAARPTTCVDTLEHLGHYAYAIERTREGDRP